MKSITLESSNIEKPFSWPLSFNQERYWFLNQFYSENVSFNYFFLINLRGALSIIELTKSLNEIVNRHEVLRCFFPIESGVPNLKIRPFCFMELPVDNLSHLSDIEREFEFERISLQEYQYSFDITNESLFHTRLIKLEDEKHVLMINVHRLIFDDASKHIFLKELSLIYKSLIMEESIKVPNLQLQYKDFVDIESEPSQNQELEGQLSYWTTQLSGELSELNIPTDYTRQTMSKFQGNSYAFSISGSIKKKIDMLSKRVNLTSQTIILTVLKILLYRYTDEKDIIIGTKVIGRKDALLKPIIGLLENNLAIRTKMQGNMTVHEALQEVGRITEEAYDHQDIPFAKVIERVNPKRNLYNSNPFFNVMLNMIKEDHTYSDIQGLIIEELNFKYDLAIVDLMLKVVETSHELKCTFTYDASLFKEDTIKRMVGHFNTILEGVLTNCDIQISQVPMLTPSEKHQLLVEWNRPTINYPRNVTIHELFEEQVKLNPDSIALLYDDTEITYRELNRRVDQIANYLLEQGIDKEQLVAIFLERSPDMIASFLAVLKAGGAYVPIDLSYPKERIAYMLKDSGVSYVITTELIKKDLPEINNNVICIDKDIIVNEEHPKRCLSPGSPDSLAYVMYTSGSTGKPKGVAIEHRGVVRLVKNINYADVGMKETFLNLGSIAFDVTVFEIYGALLNGGKLVIMNSHKPTFDEIAATIQKYHVTSVNITPERLNILLEDYSEALVGLRQVLPGGEALPVSVAHKCLTKLKECKLINLYGPTENSVNSTSYHVKGIAPDETSIPIGRPISNDCTYILDKYLQPVPIGVIGELYVSGDGIARGYLNKSEITYERFLNNPFNDGHGSKLYKTGDLVRYRSDGNIAFIGRSDDQVKIRGCRIELGEVEKNISQYHGVRQVVVWTTKGKDETNALVAYVVMKTGEIFDQKKLRSYLQEKLPEHMIPTFFVKMEKIPVTPVGKTDRKSLPIPTVNLSSQTIVSPRNEVEEKLVQLWEDLLDYNPIGIRDHYFDLGGNSILAMRMFSEIKRVFNKNLPVSIIFQEDTIEQLAALISSDKETKQETSIVAIQPLGSKPPIFCIHGGGGEVLIYKALSNFLGNDQPVYGVRYINNEENRSKSIVSLAQDYIRDIKKIQPKGPYSILGFCFGGAIAYEVAYRLIKEELEDVPLLAILNFGNPLLSKPVRLEKEIEIKNVIINNLKKLYRTPSKEKIKFLIEKVYNTSKLINTTIATHNEGTQISPRAALSKAINQYVPKPYPGDILLIKADSSNNCDDHLGWETSNKGEVYVRCVPTDHELLIKEPNIKLVVQILNEHINNYRKKVT